MSLYVKLPCPEISFDRQKSGEALRIHFEFVHKTCHIHARSGGRLGHALLSWVCFDILSECSDPIDANYRDSSEHRFLLITRLNVKLLSVCKH